MLYYYNSAAVIGGEGGIFIVAIMLPQLRDNHTRRVSNSKKLPKLHIGEILKIMYIDINLYKKKKNQIN